jgi:hypothetical protein
MIMIIPDPGTSVGITKAATDASTTLHTINTKGSSRIYFAITLYDPTFSAANTVTQS